MARSEVETKPKPKGKKRKHEKAAAASNNSSDDEVATKSLIVEPEMEEQAQRAGKRRQKENDALAKQKRIKQTPVAVAPEEVEDNPEISPRKVAKRKQREEAAALKAKRSKDDGDDDEENEESLPTDAQLQEASKPENTKAIVTVRQKKKQKHQQRLEAQKDQNSNKEAKRNEEYLLQWKNSRAEWKFVKLRQISIQQTAFDEEKLAAEIWDIALEYLASSQGAARAKISKLADEVIEKLDKEGEKLEDEAERQKLIESTRYQRARDLLQSFD
ncbi:uncharacterized protein C7orf50 [Drosophila pseudoobscura]|uniref:Uncharacterized protein C7orf50 n=1 Tax=Drosophila pseudoobscura pseudoobscura TaxID=46245 RepID=A0A6I8V1Y8_DROPS|nr:uncharacterized protein C7orf50 [Drosophila pseudoobscura]